MRPSDAPASPTRANDPTLEMASTMRKRSAELEAERRAHKKQRVLSSSNIPLAAEFEEDDSYDDLESDLTTAEELARAGLRRSIALTLNGVGFDSASADAMESFVTMAEKCMHT